MRERDGLFKRYCYKNNRTLKIAKHSNYKNARNLVIFKVKKQKKEYYQNYFQKHSKNVIKAWKSIKSIITLKSKYKTAPDLLIVNENIIINKNYIVEILNDFFVNVGSNLTSKARKKEWYKLIFH